MTDILTVTVNPVIDIHYYTEEFVIGRDNIVSCRELFAAGKGMNVSRALQAFGISTEAFLLLGTENASEYLRLAGGYGVPVSYVPAEGAVRENISVNAPDSETRLCSKSFTASPALLSRLSARIVPAAARADAAVFSGSLPRGITQKDFADFVLSIRRAAPHCRIFLDCPSLTIEAAAAIAPFLMKPNAEEAAGLLGLPRSETPSPQAAVLWAEQLCIRGQCAHTVVSCGAAGAAYASKGGASGFLTAPKTERTVSTVGAGDSMLAGIIYGFFHENTADLKSALRWGAAFGSAACLTRGTQPPEQETVLKLLRKL